MGVGTKEFIVIEFDVGDKDDGTWNLSFGAAMPFIPGKPVIPRWPGLPIHGVLTNI